MLVGVESGLVTVTHQVPTRTVFTVIEQGETKSLFADVLETSLQATIEYVNWLILILIINYQLVDLNTLTSTQISSSPVYYSHVETQYPAFGTTVSKIVTIVNRSKNSVINAKHIYKLRQLKIFLGCKLFK